MRELDCPDGPALGVGARLLHVDPQDSDRVPRVRRVVCDQGRALSGGGSRRHRARRRGRRRAELGPRPAAAPPAAASARRAFPGVSAYAANRGHTRWEGRRPVTGLGYEQPAESRPSETVAGYLASVAIFISLISLAWHPL